MQPGNNIQGSVDRRNRRLWNISFTVLIFAFVFFIFSITIANIDLWGHLKAGLDNLASRQIARTDSYSYLTAGQQWINHEWLAQILFAIAWLAGKVHGLVIFKVILGLLTVGIIYWNYYLQRIDVFISAILLLVGSILLASDFSTLYPQLFTLLFLALLLFIFLRAEEGLFRWLWLTPVIFLFWVNLHGGFLAGLGIFVLWSLFHLAVKWQDWKQIVIPLGLSILITLINPYGLGLYNYLLRSTGDIRPEILVFSPISLSSPFGLIYLFALVVSIAGIIYSQRPRSTQMILIFGFGVLLPFIAKRYLALFAVIALMVAGEHIADWLTQFDWVNAFIQRKTRAKAITALVLSGLMLILSIPNLGRIIVTPNPPNPVNAMQIIKNSQVKGNLALEYDWGSYITWHLYPEIKVSVDGRRETVYSPEVYNQNLDFFLGLGEWDALLSKYPTDMVLVNDHSPVYNLMKHEPGWDLIYEDLTGALYVRKGSPLEQPLRQAAQQFVAGPIEGYFP